MYIREERNRLGKELASLSQQSKRLPALTYSRTGRRAQHTVKARQNFCFKNSDAYRWALSCSHCSDKHLPTRLTGKEPTCQCRRHERCRFDPWVRKLSTGEGNGNPLQYSCLDRGAWRPTVHGDLKESDMIGHICTHRSHQIFQKCLQLYIKVWVFIFIFALLYFVFGWKTKVRNEFNICVNVRLEIKAQNLTEELGSRKLH